MSLKINKILLICIIVFSQFAYGKNSLVKIMLDSDDFLELHFKSGIKNSDIKIKTIQNPDKKIFDFEDIEIGDNIGKIDAMHTVSIAPNGKSQDARVLIDSDVANDGRLIRDGMVYRIKLKLNRAGNSDKKDREENQSASRVSNNRGDKKDSEENQSLRKASSNRDVIVVDAGHGGKDPGAMSDGVKEKNIVLSVARKLAQSLSNNGYKVYLTRDSDKFLTLEQRTKIADKKDAKIFISLHCNAAPNDNQAKILHGVETFFLQKTRDERSQSVAARENASVLQGTDKKSKMVIVDSVLSGPKIILSNKLAIDIQKSIISKTDARNGGVKSAPFWVLVGASRPSILVELGYITNSNEREKLLDGDYQDKIAEGIVNGILRYEKNRQKEIDN